MARIDIVDDLGKLPSMIGREIRAFHRQHTFVALLLDDCSIVNICTEEVTVGKWFEVFPIKLSSPPEYEITWNELQAPFVVAGCTSLWREEWQEPISDDGAFLGSGPHFLQCCTPIGGAPDTLEHVVKVNAGVKFSDTNQNCIVVCSSSSEPFKIDFAVNRNEAGEILKEHTCR